MNQSGKLDWFTIILAPALIIFLMVIFPIIDTVAAVAFTTLDNTTALYYTNVVKVAIGGMGLILALGCIWMIVSGLREPDSRYA